MYSLELLITFSLAAIVFGLIAGYMIAQRTAPSRQSQHQLEDHLSKLQQQQEHYQHEVTEHFVETSDLLNQLTRSYHDVHNHLAKGAQLLAGANASENLKALPSEPDEKPQYLEENSAIAPPLDYAPKAPNEPGMLNEQFGIDKAKRQQELDAIIAAEDPK